MFRNLNLKFFFAVSAFAFSAIVNAQNDSAGSSDQVLPPVRVTADVTEDYNASVAPASTKSDTPLRDTPQSISAVPRKTMDDLNVQNIGDAVLYVPGVVMAQGEGNRETPVIRGNSSTGDFFLDGMRDDVQYYRDLYNIEQLDVLKGPNGMMFGRGGVGGVINRISKEPTWTPVRQLTVQSGSDSNKRTTLDIGQGVNDSVAFRINGMYEDSGSYREEVTLERYGINPTLSARVGVNTKLTLGVEYFNDERVADRGVSSFEGRPLDVDESTFFGDPDRSPSRAEVQMANVLIDHSFNDTVLLRNRTRYADYDKFYQNVFPGATSIDGSTVSLSAYNNDTQRENIFNQTDLNFSFSTGSVRHKFLAGMELGRQETKNFRNTGFFNSVAPGTTSVSVPVSNPRTDLPITFSQSLTDADNNSQADITAFYLQDEIAFSSQFIALVGARHDDFEVDLRNNRLAMDFSSNDSLVSPRLGLIYKPIETVSLYGGYSLTYQPRAGDQLASLSITNETLDPEEFENREFGVKWDILSNLALTVASFQLERLNVAIADPNDPLLLILIDEGQETEGVEIGLAGNITNQWSIIGAYTNQDGEISADQSLTILKGSQLANLPEKTFSLWNRYDFSSAWGAGLGVIKLSERFAATENLILPESNVILPSYTRVDGAVFYTPSDRWHAQLNIENLLDEEYFEFSHNNTNITPGAPLTVRATLTAKF
jgi:catecholate siderophore receptor